MNQPACDSPKYDCETTPCQDCPSGAEGSKLQAVLDGFSRDDLPVIYISGPMSGHEKFNFPNFNEAARRLRMFGFPVINPADFGAHAGKSWKDCLVRDVGVLGHADLVMLLDGWDESRGAGLEFDVAIGLGIPAVHHDDFAEKVIHHFFGEDFARGMHMLDEHRQGICIIAREEEGVYSFAKKGQALLLMNLGLVVPVSEAV